MASTPRPLRVGIVGANAEQSWARYSHVPALQSLPDVELAVVATRHEASARAAAAAFGVAGWSADPLAMVKGDDVDLVSVCVKVPDHRALVLAALDAGKHVYCEWPLGRDLAEAEEMAGAAARAGVHVVIGVQGRANPAARRARTLLAQGAIGRVLSARVVTRSGGFGPEFPRAYAYFEDPATGANLITIQAGHALDLTGFLLGPFGEVEAMTNVQFPTVRITDTDERRPRTVPDHVVALGRLAEGGVVSVEAIGGATSPWPFAFEIEGSEGRLVLRGGDPHGYQGGELTLELNGAPEPPDAPVVPGLSGPPVNLAELYAQFARDIREGTRTVPDFAHAARLTRLLDAIVQAADTGTRQPAADWPG